MRKLFFPISILILAYLLYYYVIWFISFYSVESNQFAFFTDYLPIPANTNIQEIRVTNLLLSLLSGVTFLLALKRSKTDNPVFLRVLLIINVVVILLGFWQVIFL